MDPNPSSQVFDEVADTYDLALEKGLSLTGESKDYYAIERVRRLATLVSDGQAPEPRRILDYGCGIGDTIELLRGLSATAELAGVDASAKSLEIARRRYPTSQFCSIEELETATPFDLCYCNGVFHHIPVADRPQYAALVASRLRPGGVFALFENNPLNPGTQLVMRRIEFDRDAVKLTPWTAIRLLKDAGLEVVHVEYLFFFPKALAALRPLEGRLRKVPFGGQYLVLARRNASV